MRIYIKLRFEWYQTQLSTNLFPSWPHYAQTIHEIRVLTSDWASIILPSLWPVITFYLLTAEKIDFHSCLVLTFFFHKIQNLVFLYKNSLDPYIQTRLPYEWVARSMNKSRNMIELCDLISFRIQKLFVWNYGQKKEPWTVFLDSKFQDMTFIYCLDMNSEPRQVHLKNLTSNEVILFANIFSPYGPTSNTVHSPSVYSSPWVWPWTSIYVYIDVHGMTQ